MSIFKMPSLGADMDAGTLMEWKIKEGERVEKGQVIAEVESDKGVIEVEIFEAGVIEKLLVEPGTQCDIGTPIAVIRGKDETDEALQEELTSIAGETVAKVNTAAETPKKEKRVKKKSEKAGEPSTPRAVARHTTRHESKISPAARKRARELGIDLEVLAAKSKGKIGTDEVEAAASTKNSQKSDTKIREEGISKEFEASKQKVEQIRGGSDRMRRAIAAAMSRSNAEIPHYYLSTSINMTPALEWLEEQNRQRSIKDRILPAALTIRAVTKALQAVPKLNGFWKNGTLQMSETINPGVAIAKRTGGLVTPALLNAEQMNLDQTMAAFRDLITRTRSGKLRSSEITQQTIAITNLGDLGVERVYGVIYPPQVALVGLGRVIDTPWVEGDALAIRKVMQATLAGDHRATDGRTGALFLDKLDQILQKPEELK